MLAAGGIILNRVCLLMLFAAIVVTNIACVAGEKSPTFGFSVADGQISSSGVQVRSCPACCDGTIAEIQDYPLISALDKKCFRDCIKETWPYLPNWVKKTCNKVCTSCMRGNLLACAGCYGCTLGYATGCANECM